MKIFVSWSGEDSRAVAEILKDWLRKVIQEADIWVSSQDIGKGERWATSLWETLSDLNFGILVLTRTNTNAPWVLFEAGALAKSVKSRVIPLLCNITHIEISASPFSQFQNVLINKDEIWQMIVAINTACDRPLDETRLQETFEKWWPDFDEAFHNVKFVSDREPADQGTAEDRLTRIEHALESVIHTLQRLEKQNIRPPVPGLAKLPLPEQFEQLRCSQDIGLLSGFLRELQRGLSEKQLKDD